MPVTAAATAPSHVSLIITYGDRTTLLKSEER
jgi:hypothetical protein